MTYVAAPLFHIGALDSFVLRTLVRGGTVVVRRSFEPRTCLDDLVTHRVNSMFGVPQMFAALARVPGAFERDLTSLRTVVIAGAPVPPSLVELYARQGLLLQQAWGLAETASFATHLPAEHTLDKVGSAGIPMPYNNPAATSAAFDDGWFHSGDVGHLDEDGFLFIVDRLTDMIISGGENVYPAEVERVLAAMPGVVDVAVVGVPDDQWGAAVAAVVTVADHADITLDDLREYAARRLARYKLPRRLTLVRAVPRNAAGKLDKAVIRGLVAEGEQT